MKALTAAEMGEVDRLTTERFGIPSLQLMEAAGASVAASLREATCELAGARPLSICVLCGKGNNGGDGFVVARHMKDDATRVGVYLFGEPAELKGDAATNYQRWREAGGDTGKVVDEPSWKTAWNEIERSDVLVDAMLGTGLRGSASGLMARAIEDVNRFSRNATAARPCLLIAVDTPSGLPSDGDAAPGALLRVHKTVTFTAPKLGQLISRDCAAAGALEVASIGSPASVVEEIGRGTIRWSEPQEFAALPLVRRIDSHKGLYGHVLVVAGSLGKSGAAVMSSHAALSAGAGLVTIATPEVVLPIVATAHPEYMTEPLAATPAGTASMANLEGERFARIEAGKTVLAIGPGLGTHAETQQFIRYIVARTELPVILDADGLNAFAGRAGDLRDRQSKFLAITPHPGEMARLLGGSAKDVEQDRLKIAIDVARQWNVHVILKGFHTVIAAPDGRVFVNTSGNPGLAKGGSGDVLTGILAALTAQFKTDDWIRALALGVYLHGLAAEIVSVNSDESGTLAGQVADAVPEARRKLLWEWQRRG